MFDDHVGKVFLYTFGIILLFILPLSLIFNNNDLTEKSYLNNKVKTFVDNSRSNGYISPEEYMNFVQDITAIGEVYDIKMMHKKKMVVPHGKAYAVAYSYANKEDILTEMFGPDNDLDTNVYVYPMNEGDFFEVSIVAKKPSKGSSFFSGMFMHGGDGIKMAASAGGYVGNTHDK